METCKYGLGAGTGKPTAERRQGVLYRAYALLPQVTALEAEYSDPKTVRLAWETPGYLLPDAVTVEDGFEDYSHEAENFGGWTTIDGDTNYTLNLSGYGLKNLAWDGDKMAFRVLSDAALTVNGNKTSDWNGRPNSGDKYLVSVAPGYSSSREDWLISPELSGKEQTIEFYAASLHFGTDKYTEQEIRDKIFVYASFSGTAQSDFIKKVLFDEEKGQGEPFSLSNSLAAGDGYEKISVVLPEGTKYFAVVVVTPDCNNSVVLFDDFKYDSVQLGIPVVLNGYNVYADGQKANSEIVTDNLFVFDVEYGLTYRFEVEAVYDLGISEKAACDFSVPVPQFPAVAIEGVVADGILTLKWNAPMFAEGEVVSAVEAYDVYCDDVKIGEVPADKQTFTTDVIDGSHRYYVKVVYDGGVSEASNVYEVEWSGLDSVCVDKAHVMVSQGLITVFAASDADVSVYDIAGRRFMAAVGGMSLSVAPGVYVVVVDGESFKVRVR